MSPTSEIHNEYGEPSKDAKSPTGFYIPENLTEALLETAIIMGPKGHHEVLALTERDDMCQYHHGLGRWMRNEWHLWAGSVLSKWFNEKGITHADDMSGIILEAYWCQVHSKEFDLDTKIKFYQEYWETTKSLHVG